MKIKSLVFKQTTTFLAVKTPLDLLDATLISDTSILPSVKFFTLQAESQDIRWLDDGTVPTASVGNLLPAGQTLVVYRSQFADFKAIQVAATAIGNVTAYDGDGLPFVPISGGGSATIADGSDAVSGTTTDAIVAAGAAGTISAKLRRVTQGLEDLKTLGPTPATQVIPVTTSGAGYANGDVVGGIISLPTVNLSTGRPVTLKSLTLRDKNANAIAFDIYFFKATPAAGTYTDSSALVWGTGDAANIVGQIAVGAADWMTTIAGQSSVNYSGLDMRMSVAATTLFMLIVAKAAATLTNGNFTLNAEFDQN